MAKDIFSGFVRSSSLADPGAGLLAAFLQAYVFALLCSVYIGGATAHESH